MNLKKEIIIRIIKSLDISLIGIYYLFLGLLASLLINKIFNYKPSIDNINKSLFQKKKENKKKSKMDIFMKLCIRVALIMVSVYWIRQIVKRIPSPFNKLYGYNSKRVSEIQGGAIVAFSILALQSDFLHEIHYFIY